MNFKERLQKHHSEYGIAFSLSYLFGHIKAVMSDDELLSDTEKVAEVKQALADFDEVTK